MRSDDGAWEHRVSIKTDPHSFTCAENLAENEIFKWLQLEILKSTGTTTRLLPSPHSHARVSAHVHRMKINHSINQSINTLTANKLSIWKSREELARSHARWCVRLRFVPLSIHGELASTLENTIQWNPVNSTTVGP